MQRSISNFSTIDRQQMAEALSYASPEGPRGVICVDECRCGERAAAMNAALLYAKIVDGLTPGHDADVILRKLREAIALDVAAPQWAKFPIDELARVDVSVSRKNLEVVAARIRFARTWDALQSILGC